MFKKTAENLLKTSGILFRGVREGKGGEGKGRGRGKGREEGSRGGEEPALPIKKSFSRSCLFVYSGCAPSLS